MNLAVHEDKFLSGGRNRRSWTGLLCSRKAHRLSKNRCNACRRAKPKQLAAREILFVIGHRVPPYDENTLALPRKLEVVQPRTSPLSRGDYAPIPFPLAQMVQRHVDKFDVVGRESDYLAGSLV